ncbi:hypothetical protein KR044_008700, partial [Drosophila immigrans]
MQFLLLCPRQVLNTSLMLEPKLQKINYLGDVIENVLKEKSAETLLLLQRRQDLKCPLKDFNIEGMPIVRMDESTVVPMKSLFNCRIIAVVCMSELADSMLFTVLAKDLDRMREARIIIWLQSDESTAETLLNVIRDRASKYSIVYLLVLHSDPSKLKKGFVAFRLEPFPTPTWVLIEDLNKGLKLPDFWHNFRNKTAKLIPSLYAPGSYIIRDRKSGKLRLSGHTDILMMEFAKKRNINLELLRPIEEIDIVANKRILISNGSADLSTISKVCDANSECSITIDISQIFIVVPCGEEVGIGGVYRSLKNFLLILLGVYLIVSVVTTLVEAAACRIFGRRYRFSYGDVFVNMNAFRWVLGLSSDVHRDRRSMSLHQIIMVMSIFSLIIICFFNANLSTFLTKQPRNNNIKTFKELRESGIPVIFDKVHKKFVLSDIKNSYLRIPETQIVFESRKKYVSMLMQQNASYAYQVYDKLWKAVTSCHEGYKRADLCRSLGLNIFGLYPNNAYMPFNSIYLQALNDFINSVHDFGLMNHWKSLSITNLVAYSNRSRVFPQPTPLNYNDLKWVWNLLAICYIASILVFIGELCVHRWQMRRVPIF